MEMGTDRPMDLILVLTTEADLERAERLARELLSRRLVACVSLQPLHSLYRWHGELEKAEEVQLLLKTSPAQFEALERAVMDLHSYDTPEWIHWRASAAEPYGRWLAASVGEALSPGGC